MKKTFLSILTGLAILVMSGSVFAEESWVSKNQSGLIGSPSKPIRKLYIGSLTPLVLEGVTTDS